MLVSWSQKSNKNYERGCVCKLRKRWCTRAVIRYESLELPLYRPKQNWRSSHAVIKISKSMWRIRKRDAVEVFLSTLFFIHFFSAKLLKNNKNFKKNWRNKWEMLKKTNKKIFFCTNLNEFLRCRWAIKEFVNCFWSFEKRELQVNFCCDLLLDKEMNFLIVDAGKISFPSHFSVEYTAILL